MRIIAVAVLLAKAGLYDSDRDKAIIEYLDNNNFATMVPGCRDGKICEHGPDSSWWAVEFYASWCGHCQRYAKTWREVGLELQPMRPSVRVGAIDCGDKSNTPTCSKHKIRSFPTIKLFDPNGTFFQAEGRSVYLCGQEMDHRNPRSSTIGCVFQHQNDLIVAVPAAATAAAATSAAAVGPFAISCAKGAAEGRSVCSVALTLV